MEGETREARDNTRAVQVRLSDDTIFYIQAKNLNGEEDVSIKFASFEKVTKAIKGVAKELADIWKVIEPSKASVEFDVEFVWEAGDLTAMFVNTSTTASMKITLEWGKPVANP